VGKVQPVKVSLAAVLQVYAVSEQLIQKLVDGMPLVVEGLVALVQTL
jgi:hypothetical protein